LDLAGTLDLESWSKYTIKELLTYTHSQLVLLRQLIHTQNGNDILERLVVLENLLDSSRNLVVLLANLLLAMSDLKLFLTLSPYNARIQHAGLRVKRIDGRINTELSNRARQYSGSVQVGEGRGRGRIRQVIGWDIHSLYGGDGSFLGSSDTFLPRGKMRMMHA
jgi:hypothetical protein